MAASNALSRRRFLTTSAAVASAAPFAVGALNTSADVFEQDTDFESNLRARGRSPENIPPLDIEANVADEFHLAFIQSAGALDLNDLDSARLGFEFFINSLPPAPAGVTVHDVFVPSNDGHDIRLRVFRPDHITAPAPVFYWMHGGGLVLGRAEQDDFFNGSIALELGIIVVAVDYRLAPENPYPKPIMDCYHGLLGMVDMSEELGIDPTRIAIGGNSSGAGLAAALAIAVRNLGGPDIRLQLLTYPQLDDRNITYSSHAVTDPRVWNRESNLLSWDYYLPNRFNRNNVPVYAAAARAKNLRNLPPTYMNVGSLDLFLDENINYAQRLLRSGVPTELQVYPGAFHASNIFVPQSPLSQRWTENEYNALGRALIG